MLLAYCDASLHKNNRAVATTLILTEVMYVTCFSKTYENVASSTDAELLGVLQTVRYVHDNCADDKRVVLFTDNLSIVLQYISILANWSVPENINNREIYL